MLVIMSRGRPLRPWGLHVLTATALAVFTAAACGGSSSSTDGSGAKGGSSAAGKGGTSTGGSSGSAGKGGSAAGRGSAAGGSGGSAGASSATGGSAGTTNVTGGTSSRGGTGGSSGSGEPGGEAGTGGTGAMTGYHPPDSQIDGCETLCAQEATAACENETTLEKCIEDCRVGILFEDCAEQWDDLFACTEDSEVECNAEGEATFADCTAQATATYACVLGDGLDPEFNEPCGDYCAANTAAECESTPSSADCATTCVIIASAFPVCNEVFSRFIECGADSEYGCNADGEPEPTECGGQYLTFLGCILTEYEFVP